ncbi:hypothetical protein, partial [Bilophila wadsworthia]|uniref:hypothetical protein n=1 Tax=Bilophila wadsworthia TaxID=35833 RepID=UPI0032204B78
MLLLANGNGPFVSIKKRIRKGIIKKIKALALEWFFLKIACRFYGIENQNHSKGGALKKMGPIVPFQPPCETTELLPSGLPTSQSFRGEREGFGEGKGSLLK